VAVPIRFRCSCGEELQVPAGTVGRMAFCLKCRRSVPIPGVAGAQDAPDAAAGTRGVTAGFSSTNDVVRVTRAGEGGAAVGAGRGASAEGAKGEEAQCVLVHGEDGQDYWRVICSCGKHVRTPVAVGRPYGRCPKCGQMLKMPGYVQPKLPGRVPAEPVAHSVPSVLFAEESASGGAGKPVQKSGEDESETAAFGAAPVGERISRDAAIVAADRLRPSYAGASGRMAEAESRISAWPLAGKGVRVLAAFIDLTIGVVLAGILVFLARKHVLPETFNRIQMVIIVWLFVQILNDGLVHMIIGGSIGKKLALITTRTASGKEMTRARTLARALLKWLLLPGWLIGIVDPSGRTLHDLLCDTLVLRGRAKGRRFHGE